MTTFVYPHNGIYISIWGVVAVILLSAVLEFLCFKLDSSEKVKKLSFGNLIVVFVFLSPLILSGLLIHALVNAYETRSEELETVIAQTYGIDKPYVSTLNGNSDSFPFEISRGGNSLNKLCVAKHLNGDRLVGYVVCQDVVEKPKTEKVSVPGSEQTLSPLK